MDLSTGFQGISIKGVTTSVSMLRVPRPALEKGNGQMEKNGKLRKVFLRGADFRVPCKTIDLIIEKCVQTLIS